MALTNDSSCVMAAVINVKGSRWSPKYFVLTRRQEGGLQLSRFANDVATQPEHVATLEACREEAKGHPAQPAWKALLRPRTIVYFGVWAGIGAGLLFAFCLDLAGRASNPQD